MIFAATVSFDHNVQRMNIPMCENALARLKRPSEIPYKLKIDLASTVRFRVLEFPKLSTGIQGPVASFGIPSNIFAAFTSDPAEGSSFRTFELSEVRKNAVDFVSKQCLLRSIEMVFPHCCERVEPGIRDMKM
jgi:hypothetical protein